MDLYEIIWIVFLIIIGIWVLNEYYNEYYNKPNFRIIAGGGQEQNNFHVLIATVGRSSLQNMLDSLLPQLNENDHLTIVFDGKSEIPKFDFSKKRCQLHQYYEKNALGYFGHGIRNKYASLLQPTTFVMHGDDDDKYTDGIFEELRKQCNDKNTLYIMKMNQNGNILPIDNIIQMNNIGTPNGIIPYELNKEGIWGYKRGGDGEFYENISAKAQKIIFLPNIGYIVQKK